MNSHRSFMLCLVLLASLSVLLAEITFSEDLLKRAKAGNSEAQTDLGKCYQNGYGVSADTTEALIWYRLAADQGFAQAQYDLALCYYHGEGVEQDYKEAAKWYRLAADQGLAEAQYYLGDMYYRGNGVEANNLEALKWLYKAASQAHPYANSLIKGISLSPEEKRYQAEEREKALKKFGELHSTIKDSSITDHKENSSRLRQWDKAPVAIGGIKLDHIDTSRLEGTDGVLILDVIIYKDGSVGNIKVLRSAQPGPGGLDEMVMKAVRDTPFKPGTSNGKPVDASFMIPFDLKRK